MDGGGGAASVWSGHREFVGLNAGQSRPLRSQGETPWERGVTGTQRCRHPKFWKEKEAQLRRQKSDAGRRIAIKTYHQVKEKDATGGGGNAGGKR